MIHDLSTVRRELEDLLTSARAQFDDDVDPRVLLAQVLAQLTVLSARLVEQSQPDETTLVNVRRDHSRVGTQIGVIHGDATIIHSGGDWR